MNCCCLMRYRLCWCLFGLLIVGDIQWRFGSRLWLLAPCVCCGYFFFGVCIDFCRLWLIRNCWWMLVFLCVFVLLRFCVTLQVLMKNWGEGFRWSFSGVFVCDRRFQFIGLGLCWKWKFLTWKETCLWGGVNRVWPKDPAWKCGAGWRRKERILDPCIITFGPFWTMFFIWTLTTKKRYNIIKELK